MVAPLFSSPFACGTSRLEFEALDANTEQVLTAMAQGEVNHHVIAEMGSTMAQVLGAFASVLGAVASIDRAMDSAQRWVRCTVAGSDQSSSTTTTLIGV
jgi:hypothetical protein